jgi:hypothetical protein
MKLVESGEIDHVKVGSHHRIPAEAILAFQRARRARRDKAPRHSPSSPTRAVSWIDDQRRPG